MKILFFDDESIRFDIFKTRFESYVELVYCQTFPEVQFQLEQHINGNTYFDIVHFDHDIQDLQTKEWFSSQHIAKWFVDNCPKDKKPKSVVVHSVNPQHSWSLYHIFSLLTKTWMCPFRLENSSEVLLSATLSNDN